MIKKHDDNLAIRIADAVRGGVFGAILGTFSSYFAFYLIGAENNHSLNHPYPVNLLLEYAYQGAERGMLVVAFWGLLIGACYWVASQYLLLRHTGSPCGSNTLKKADLVRCGIYGLVAGPMFGVFGTSEVYPASALGIYAMSLAFWGMLAACLFSALTMRWFLGRKDAKAVAA